MHGVKRGELFCSPKENFNPKTNPTIYVNLPSEEVANRIVSRSILIKEILDVHIQINDVNSCIIGYIGGIFI